MQLQFLQKRGQTGRCGSYNMCWPSRAGRKEIALISVSCFLQIATSKSRCGPQINWPCVPMFQFLFGLFITILAPTISFASLLPSLYLRSVCVWVLSLLCAVCLAYCSNSDLHAGAVPRWAQNVDNITFSLVYLEVFWANIKKTQCRSHQLSYFLAIFSHFSHTICPLHQYVFSVKLPAQIAVS